MTITTTMISELRRTSKNGEDTEVELAALELLIALGEQAWQLYPGKGEVKARRDHVRPAFRGDPTWIVAKRACPELQLNVVQWVIHQASLRREKKIAELKRAVHGDHPRETAGGSESAGPSPSPTRRSPTAPTAAPTTEALPPGPTTTGRDRARERVAARVRVERRLCRLDTVFVDGKAIGDCLVAEVRDWARRREEESRVAARDARFALALISNLDGGQVIRHHWPDPAAVDELYEAASAETRTRG